jgi:hypothetical protein
MNMRYIIIVLSILQIPPFALAIDFNKPSTAATGALSNDALMQAITKEKFFDLICEKAELIQNNSGPVTPGVPVQNGSGYDPTPTAASLARDAQDAAAREKYGATMRNSNNPGRKAADTPANRAAKVRRGLWFLMNGLTVTGGTVCMADPSLLGKLEGQVCVLMQPPLSDGGMLLKAAFFNSYGRELEKEKECQDAEIRVKSGYDAVVMYYIEKTPANENKAIQAVESARKIPNKCRDKVVDFITYADKRLGQCIR